MNRIFRSTIFLLSAITVGFGVSGSRAVRAQISASPAQASSNDHIAPRVIWAGRGNRTYPIGTFLLFYDGKPIKSGVPFDAPDDWLKHVSVSFQNRSYYPLVEGTLQLDFRELGGTPILFYDLRFGVVPEHQLYAPSGRRVPRPLGETPISVAPGAIASIPFAPHYSELRSAIETRSSLAQLKSCWVSYGGFFYFGNDLRWAATDSFTRTNPSVLGQYLPASPEDFMAMPPQ